MQAAAQVAWYTVRMVMIRATITDAMPDFLSKLQSCDLGQQRGILAAAEAGIFHQMGARDMQSHICLACCSR